MTDSAPRMDTTKNAKGTLYLQFTIGDQRFALEAREVIRILPRRTLKPIPQAPAWVAGILAYQGALIPVIDLSTLSLGQPAPARTSTRLVLVRYRADARRPSLQLGLILAQANETLRCRADDFQPYGLDNGKARYLGPVRQDEWGLLQRIHVDDLLPESVRCLLFPEEPPQVQA
ncbi:chemotaxis protein CheW [Pseudomonas capeferrum]|uniref:chemotaxis protein CheW n=1 Tax=Pseudomonas capeferrum TaxID=1495066 RepID=UPI0015E45699|nr:chemotaxis protein CheW [Pseudomonas capeferrum]MBA1203735.1 chemotaxis protein CheW [Pseudomonas capeferrum]